MRRLNTHLIPLAFAFAAGFVLPIALHGQDDPWNSVPQSIKERKSYKRFEWFYRQRADEQGKMPVDVYYSERDKAIAEQQLNRDRDLYIKMQSPQPLPTALSWTAIGPGTISSGYPPHWGNVSGRVRALAVHPTDQNTVYIGAASGGIWKTTNGGSSWADIGYTMESLSFGAIAIDPANPNNVYAGAGEARYLFNKVTYDGAGLFKSTNGGTSWTNITNGFGTITHFSDIVVSPHNSNFILAALGSGYWFLGGPGNEGIWRSTDAGTTWTRVMNANDSYDIEYHPTDANIVYASAAGAFLRSTDAGATWSAFGSGLPAADAIDRIHISLAKNTPATIYAVIYTSSGSLPAGTTAWKSTDGGANWSQISAGTPLGGNYGSGWNDQGSYDLCIAASPADANRVLLGNVEMHLTTNGSSFAVQRVAPASNAWQCPIHVDIHIFAFAPSTASVVYAGCDGGIFKSTDAGATWTSVNGSLPTIQLYRISSHPTTRDAMIGGAQDNGNFRKTATGTGPWTFLTTGDGMESIYDYSNPSIMYFSTQNGSLYKSTNAGVSYSKVYTVNGAWVTPFVIHPTTPSTLYSANTSFLRSTDGGVNWTTVSSGVAADNIIAIAVHPANPSQIMIAGSGDYNSNSPVKVSTNGGTSWTDVTANIPGSQRYIPRVYAHPANAGTFFAVRSGFVAANHLYKTTNLGATWTNISGNLPTVPHSCFFVDPVTDYYYAGNDLGVYRSTDGGTTWSLENSGMPVVPVIDFAYSSIGIERILRAATHGRSVYEALLSAPCTPAAVSSDPSNDTKCSGLLASFTASATGTSPVTVQWQRSPNGSSWAPISGATNTTLNIATHDTLNGWRYRAVFTNACGSDTTTAAVLTVNGVPRFTTQPANATVCSGTTASFTPVITGAVSYQWYSSPDGVTFSPLGGQTAAQLSFTTATGDNGKRYRVVAANSCGSDTSDAALLTVNGAPSFSANPSNKSVCEGSNVTFNATPVNALSQQWEQSSDGLVYSAIAGQTGTSLSFTPLLGDNGKWYRLRAINSCDTSWSAAGQLTVLSGFGITSHPASVSICDSGWVTFSARASGSPAPTVVWEQSPDGVSYTTISSATDTVYSFYATTPFDGMRFRARFTAVCGQFSTNPALLTVGRAAIVTADPAGSAICSGDTAYFSISAPGTVLQAQWQRSPDGIVYTDIPGANGLNLNVPGVALADSGVRFRAWVSNSCGADTSSPAVLTVVRPASIVGNPSNMTVCLGSVVLFSANANDYSGIQWESSSDGINYSLIPGANSLNYSFTPALADNGKRYRAVFSDACGGAHTTPALLGVSTRPTVSQQPSNKNVCTGSNAVFRAAANASPAAGVQWQQSPDGVTYSNIPGANRDSLVVSASPALHQFRYRAVYSNGCGNDTTNSAQLLVSSGFAVNAGADAEYCQGGSHQLNAIVSGGTGPYLYAWSPSTGLSDASIPDPLASPSTTTEYVLTVTDGVGCVATDSIVIDVNQKPFAHAGADAVICSGATVLLGDTATGGTPPYLYSWSPSSGLSAATDAMPLAAPTSTTIYTVTVTDGKGCTAADQVLVTVNPSPRANAGADKILCVGSTAAIGEPATGGTPPYTYSWQPVTGLSETDIASPLVSPAGTTVYVVTVTDAKGCIVTDSVNVTVRPRPLVNAGADTSICKGASVHIGEAATNGTPPYTYVWTPTTGLSNANIPDPVASPFTTTTYTLTIIDASGCVTTDRIHITVRNAPGALAGSDATICGGEEVLLGNYATGGTPPYTYQWTPAVGLSNPGIAKPVAKPLATTTYTVTVTDSMGCVATDQVVVRVNPQPMAHAGPDRTICKGAPVLLGDVATGGTPPFTYIWFPDNGLSSANTSSPLARPDASTIYSVTVTDSKGCVSTDEVFIEVVELAQPVIIPNRPPSICKGEKVTLGLSELYDSYKWSTGATTPTITVDKGGEYFVIVSNALNCRDTSMPIIVTVSPLPTPVVMGPAAVCPDTQATYSVVPQDDISYDWTITGGIIIGDSYGSSVRVQWTMIGTGVITAHALNTVTGCIKDTAFRVQVSPTFQPVITSNRAPRFCEGEEIILDAGPGYQTYQWSTGAATQKCAIRTAGDYWVKVSLPSGCTGTSQLFHVEVLPRPYPVITYSGPLQRCEGESIVLDAGAGYVSYKWNTGETTRTITATTSGSHTVTVSNTAGCFWTSGAIYTQFVKPPQVTITGNTVVCQHSAAVYLAPVAAGIKYKWTVVGGTILRGTDSSNVLVNWFQAGTGVVTLEMSNAGICVVSKSQNITVTPTQRPVITPRGPTTVCEGVSVILEAPAGYVKYRWSNGDSTRICTAKKAGNYFVDTRDQNGCEFRSDPVAVSIAPQPLAVIDGPVRIPPGEEASFTAAPEPGNIYYWQTQRGNIVAGQGTPKVYISWNSDGPDSITVTVTSALGCKNQAGHKMEITGNYFPEVTAYGETTVCEGDTVILAGPAGSQGYQWSTGETTPEIYVTKTGRYKVTVADRYGFLWDSKPIDVYVIPTPRPRLKTYGLLTICDGERVPIEAPDNFAMYEWTNGDGSSRIYADKPGLYFVNVTDIYGCKGVSDTVEVIVLPAPAKPAITQKGKKLIASEGADTYQWYLNGLKIPGATSRMYQSDVMGVYTVRAGNEAGCSTISDPYQFTVIFTNVIIPLTLNGDAGETIRVPVLLRVDEGLEKAEAMPFTATIAFYKNILQPKNAPYEDRGDWRYATLTGSVPTFAKLGDDAVVLDSGASYLPIAEFELLAMLGTRSSTPIRIEELEFEDYRISANAADGLFTLNICREGGERLFDSNGRISLNQNRPNPFNTSTTVEYEIIERGRTQLYVVDMLGRRIKTLVDTGLEPGRYSISFDLGDVPTGTYMYVLQTPTQTRQKLMELVK